jgi:hypothetical protein
VITAGMVDRQKLETILTGRLLTATHHQVAAATNAFRGLSDE